MTMMMNLAIYSVFINLIITYTEVGITKILGIPHQQQSNQLQEISAKSLLNNTLLSCKEKDTLCNVVLNILCLSNNRMVWLEGNAFEYISAET